MFEYPVELISAKDGGFVVTFPDVPEAITQGDDKDEALQNASEALETALSFYIEDRRQLPLPSTAAGRPTVTPDAIVIAKMISNWLSVKK
ncbi:MAG: type II toxin-antitoxin system HicB family antitoxin [Candidatus Nitrotoga sp.]